MNALYTLGHQIYEIGTWGVKGSVVGAASLAIAYAAGLIRTQNEGKPVERKIAVLAARIGIVAPITVHENDHHDSECVGSNFFSSHVTLQLNPRNQNFDIAHHLSRIKYHLPLIEKSTLSLIAIAFCFSNGSTTLIAALLGRQILCTHLEQSVDDNTCNYLTTKDIAAAVRELQKILILGNLEKEALSHGSLLQKLYAYFVMNEFGEDYLFSHSHQSTPSRIERLKNIYYSRPTSELKIKWDSKDRKVLLMPSLIRKIRAKIRGSSKENLLIGTTTLVFKKTEKNNVEFLFKEGPPAFYTVSLEKLYNFENSLREELLLEIIDDALNNPFSLVFTFKTEKVKLKEITQFLSEKIPSYDFSTLEIIEKGGITHLKIPGVN